MNSTESNRSNFSQPGCLEANDVSFMLFYIVRTSITSILITFTLVANFLLLLIVWKVKSIRKIKNECYGYYLINLSIIDISAAVICTICMVMYEFDDNLEDDSCHQITNIFWRTYSSIHILLSSGWIATISIMIMEKFQLNKNPLLKRKTFRRMKSKLNVVWVWALFNSLPQLVLYHHVNLEVHCSCEVESEDSMYVRIYAALRITSMFVIPSFIILISSAGVLSPHSVESALTLKRKKGNHRFVYLVITLWVTFILSNLPKCLLDVVASFNVVDTRKFQSEQIFMYILLTSWTIYLITPIIYIVIYGRILRPELKKLLKRSSYRSGNSIYGGGNHSNRRASLFSNNLTTDDSDVESYLTRRLFRNIGILDGNMIQNLSFDLCREEVNYSRRTSLMGESLGRKHSLLGSVIGENSRNYSIFRKKSGVTAEGLMNVMEGRFLSSLVPTYEHSVNRLNQKTTLLEAKRPRHKLSINVNN